jgi:hypothetical protein
VILFQTRRSLRQRPGLNKALLLTLRHIFKKSQKSVAMILTSPLHLLRQCSHYLAQANIKPEIFLPQPPEYWDYILYHHLNYLNQVGKNVLDEGPDSK